MYVDHVIQKYGESSVLVCDGYEGPPSTKSQEHMRRSLKNSSPDIFFSEITPVMTPQQNFLANSKNKSCLIRSIKALGELDISQAISDADTLIVSTALELCKTEMCVIVVGNDTDLLILLVSQAKDGENVFFVHPGTNTTAMKVYDIQKIRTHLGNKVDITLPLHTFSGSDTISAVFLVLYL